MLFLCCFLRFFPLCKGVSNIAYSFSKYHFKKCVVNYNGAFALEIVQCTYFPLLFLCEMHSFSVNIFSGNMNFLHGLSKICLQKENKNLSANKIPKKKSFFQWNPVILYFFFLHATEERFTKEILQQETLSA